MDPEQLPLRDLHLPDAIGWWPLATGWWVLIGLLFAMLLVWTWLWLKKRKRDAARRYAMRELDGYVADFRRDGDAIRFGLRASELLRRAMLAYAPRADVASLTGEAWLTWLDRDLAQPVFRQGPGRQLIELPYRNPDSKVEVDDLDQLVGAIRHRLATPIGVNR